MSFFGLGKSTSSSSSFGYKVNSIDGVPSELESVKGKIVQTSKKYRDELTKYREIAAFNQQLSNGYVRNLEAMVDVSRIMNYYIEIFNVLRDEFDKNERVLGTSLTNVDISYLERLTKSKMDELNNKFMNESEKLKKLYSQYGKNEELARVQEAQRSLMTTTESAEQSYQKLRQITSNAQQGTAMVGGKSRCGTLVKQTGKKIKSVKLNKRVVRKPKK